MHRWRKSMDIYTKICPQCNAAIPLSSRFCPKCGTLFPSSQTGASSARNPHTSVPSPDPVPIPSETFRGYLLTDLEICIGSQFQNYMERFSKRRHKKCTFNWCSAFFGLDWLLYRKMWKTWLFAYGILTFSTFSYHIFLSTLCFLSGFPLGFSQLAMNHPGTAALLALAYRLLLAIAWGFLGDKLYWRHLRELLIRHQCFRRPPVYDDALFQALQENGGTLTISEMLMAFFICLFPTCAGSAAITAGCSMYLKLLSHLFP